MSKPMKKTRQSDAGITLLEVLVVLAIIAMITALATPRLMDSFGRAKARTADVQAANLRAAVQMFYLDTGQLPAQSAGLGALVQAPPGISGWSGPYLDADQIADPWGRDWVYRQPGEDQLFSLTSFGRDGQPGGTGEDSDISF